MAAIGSISLIHSIHYQTFFHHISRTLFKFWLHLLPGKTNQKKKEEEKKEERKGERERKGRRRKERGGKGCEGDERKEKERRERRKTLCGLQSLGMGCRCRFTRFFVKTSLIWGGRRKKWREPAWPLAPAL